MWKPMMNFASDLVSGWWTSGKNTDDQKPDTVVSLTSLERKQEMLAHMVRLLARGKSTSLFVVGDGGVGKSRTIRRTLESEGKKYVLLNSHATPMSLYRVLFENRDDKVVWLDDADSIYANMQVLGLLRSATWNDVERVVTYTSSQLTDIPDRFVFNSRIVFCANRIPRRNEAFRALVSRCDIYTLQATSEEMLEQMRLLAASGYGSLAPQQCLEVVEFIERTAGSRQVSMRLYEPSLKKLEYALQVGVDWRPLVRTQLDEIGYAMDTAPPVAGADEMDSLRQVMAEYSTVGEQQEAWCRAARRSRATFYRMKKALGKAGEQVGTAQAAMGVVG